MVSKKRAKAQLLDVTDEWLRLLAIANKLGTDTEEGQKALNSAALVSLEIKRLQSEVLGK